MVGLVAVLAMVGLLGCQPVRPGLNPGPTVGTILILGPHGIEGFGTGVLLTPNYILTARHVVEGFGGGTAMFFPLVDKKPGGEEDGVWVWEQPVMLGLEDGGDIAVIGVQTPLEQATPTVIDCSPAEFQNGQRLWAKAILGGNTLVTFPVYVTSAGFQPHEPGLVSVMGPLHRGMSGGVVMDDGGAIVGVLTDMYAKPLELPLLGFEVMIPQGFGAFRRIGPSCERIGKAVGGGGRAGFGRFQLYDG